jgi:beta-lactamase class A
MLRRIPGVLLILALGIAIGYAIGFYQPHTQPVQIITEKRQSEGQLTNQLLECAELPEVLSIGNRINLEQQISEKIEALKKEGKLTKGAVYYRDLNNGPWFGVNEEDLYYPASLLKVPLAMGFYWQAEGDPSLLTSKHLFKRAGEDLDMGTAFASARRLEDGTEYTVEELLTFMLQDSSNEAALLLAEIAGQEKVLEVYDDLGIPEPTYGQDYQISVHTLGSLFRIIFNATYLNRINSEKLLTTMTESGFTEGLEKGVPPEITVAHKFGVREVDGIRQLHDCGIVYAPGKPYILCVMTQGSEYDVLANFIKEVSAEVYSAVTQ